MEGLPSGVMRTWKWCTPSSIVTSTMKSPGGIQITRSPSGLVYTSCRPYGQKSAEMSSTGLKGSSIGNVIG